MASRAKSNIPKPNGALELSYHRDLLCDDQRLNKFLEAISRVCQDKIVLNSGAGCGVHSIFAARKKAKHVFAIESDPIIAAIAQRNIEASSLSNISLLEKSALEITAEDLDQLKPEVIIAEHLSTWQLAEPLIPVMNYLLTEVAVKEPCCLPQKISNYLQLTESQYIFYDDIELRVPFYEFASTEKAKSMSDRELVAVFSCQEINQIKVEKEVKIRATHPGVINSLRLTSPLVIYEDIDFLHSDTLMTPVVVPLECELKVKQGDIINIQISYEAGGGWQSFSAVAQQGCSQDI